MAKYQADFGLSAYDAAQLCDEKATAVYFESVIALTTNYKAAANWIIGPIRQQLNELGLSIESFSLTPEYLVQLIQLVENGKVSFSLASSKLLTSVINENISPITLAESLNLIQIQDTSELENYIQQVLNAMPDKVAAYKKGKKGLIGLFVGEVKKQSKGKADPKLVTELIEKKLNN